MKLKFDVEGVAEKAFAGRWIAGARIKDAIGRATDLNALRESAVISYLGGESGARWEVADAVSTYQRLIKAIGRNGVDASISLGVAQIGLDMGRGVARRNYEGIARRARKQGTFVWLDACAHDKVDSAIAVYRRQMERGGVGICLRAELRRTEQDVKALVEDGAVIKLAKGVPDNGRIAFATKREIAANYARLMGFLFRGADEFTVATRDPAVISEALLLSRSYRRRVTYEMPSGPGSAYAGKLAGLGNRVAIGVPFGRHWTGYAYKMLGEELGAVPLLGSLMGGV
jgi:proline dehydrogenase